MKISVHTSHYPYPQPREGYVSGGGERVAEAISRELVDRGHTVEVYTASADGTERSGEGSLSVSRFRSIGRIGETAVAPRQFVPISQPTDVVHVHNTTPPGVISGVIHAAVVDAPLVVTHHGNDRYVPTNDLIKRTADYLYANVLLDHILQYADQITIPSLTYLEGSTRLSEHREKITEIPNGIYSEQYSRPDLSERANEKFGLAPTDALVLFVGNLIPKKGPDILVDAAKSLPDDTQVIVAGSGPLLQTLRDRCPEGVTLAGYVSETDKIALYNRADLFCLPSRTRTEVFPLVILEAYASGTPVVASDLETFDTLVSSDTGARFENENVEALVEALESLLSSREVLSELAHNARRIARSYQWGEIAVEYESLFQTLVEG